MNSANEISNTGNDLIRDECAPLSNHLPTSSADYSGYTQDVSRLYGQMTDRSHMDSQQPSSSLNETSKQNPESFLDESAGRIAHSANLEDQTHLTSVESTMEQSVQYWNKSYTPMSHSLPPLSNGQTKTTPSVTNNKTQTLYPVHTYTSQNVNTHQNDAGSSTQMNSALPPSRRVRSTYSYKNAHSNGTPISEMSLRDVLKLQAERDRVEREQRERMMANGNPGNRNGQPGAEGYVNSLSTFVAPDVIALKEQYGASTSSAQNYNQLNYHVQPNGVMDSSQPYYQGVMNNGGNNSHNSQPNYNHTNETGHRNKMPMLVSGQRTPNGHLQPSQPLLPTRLVPTTSTGRIQVDTRKEMPMQQHTRSDVTPAERPSRLVPVIIQQRYTPRVDKVPPGNGNNVQYLQNRGSQQVHQQQVSTVNRNVTMQGSSNGQKVAEHNERCSRPTVRRKPIVRMQHVVRGESSAKKFAPTVNPSTQELEDLDLVRRALDTLESANGRSQSSGGQMLNGQHDVSLLNQLGVSMEKIEHLQKIGTGVAGNKNDVSPRQGNLQSPSSSSSCQSNKLKGAKEVILEDEKYPSHLSISEVVAMKVTAIRKAAKQQEELNKEEEAIRLAANKGRSRPVQRKNPEEMLEEAQGRSASRQMNFNETVPRMTETKLLPRQQAIDKNAYYDNDHQMQQSPVSQYSNSASYDVKVQVDQQNVHGFHNNADARIQPSPIVHFSPSNSNPVHLNHVTDGQEVNLHNTMGYVTSKNAESFCVQQNNNQQANQLIRTQFEMNPIGIRQEQQEKGANINYSQSTYDIEFPNSPESPSACSSARSVKTAAIEDTINLVIEKARKSVQNKPKKVASRRRPVKGKSEVVVQPVLHQVAAEKMVVDMAPKASNSPVVELIKENNVVEPMVVETQMGDVFSRNTLAEGSSNGPSSNFEMQTNDAFYSNFGFCGNEYYFDPLSSFMQETNPEPVVEQEIVSPPKKQALPSIECIFPRRSKDTSSSYTGSSYSYTEEKYCPQVPLQPVVPVEYPVDPVQNQWKDMTPIPQEQVIEVARAGRIPDVESRIFAPEVEAPIRMVDESSKEEVKSACCEPLQILPTSVEGSKKCYIMSCLRRKMKRIRVNAVFPTMQALIKRRHRKGRFSTSRNIHRVERVIGHIKWFGLVKNIIDRKGVSKKGIVIKNFAKLLMNVLSAVHEKNPRFLRYSRVSFWEENIFDSNKRYKIVEMKDAEIQFLTVDSDKVKAASKIFNKNDSCGRKRQWYRICKHATFVNDGMSLKNSVNRLRNMDLIDFIINVNKNSIPHELIDHSVLEAENLEAGECVDGFKEGFAHSNGMLSPEEENKQLHMEERKVGCEHKIGDKKDYEIPMVDDLLLTSVGDMPDDFLEPESPFSLPLIPPTHSPLEYDEVSTKQYQNHRFWAKERDIATNAIQTICSIIFDDRHLLQMPEEYRKAELTKAQEKFPTICSAMAANKIEPEYLIYYQGPVYEQILKMIRRWEIRPQLRKVNTRTLQFIYRMYLFNQQRVPKIIRRFEQLRLSKVEKLGNRASSEELDRINLYYEEQKSKARRVSIFQTLRKIPSSPGDYEVRERKRALEVLRKKCILYKKKIRFVLNKQYLYLRGNGKYLLFKNRIERELWKANRLPELKSPHAKTQLMEMPEGFNRKKKIENDEEPNNEEDHDQELRKRRDRRDNSETMTFYPKYRTSTLSRSERVRAREEARMRILENTNSDEPTTSESNVSTERIVKIPKVIVTSPTPPLNRQRSIDADGYSRDLLMGSVKQSRSSSPLEHGVSKTTISDGVRMALINKLKKSAWEEQDELYDEEDEASELNVSLEIRGNNGNDEDMNGETRVANQMEEISTPVLDTPKMEKKAQTIRSRRRNSMRNQSATKNNRRSPRKKADVPSNSAGDEEEREVGIDRTTTESDHEVVKTPVKKRRTRRKNADLLIDELTPHAEDLGTVDDVVTTRSNGKSRIQKHKENHVEPQQEDIAASITENHEVSESSVRISPRVLPNAVPSSETATARRKKSDTSNIQSKLIETSSSTVSKRTRGRPPRNSKLNIQAEDNGESTEGASQKMEKEITPRRRRKTNNIEFASDLSLDTVAAEESSKPKRQRRTNEVGERSAKENRHRKKNGVDQDSAVQESGETREANPELDREVEAEQSTGNLAPEKIVRRRQYKTTQNR